MTHHPHASSLSGCPDPRDAVLTEALSRTALDHLDVEPKARELERMLRMLFGEHPRGTRSWVTIERSDDGSTVLGIADIDPDRVLSMTRRIDDVVNMGHGGSNGATDRSVRSGNVGPDGRPLPLHARRGGMR